MFCYYPFFYCTLSGQRAVQGSGERVYLRLLCLCSFYHSIFPEKNPEVSLESPAGPMSHPLIRKMPNYFPSYWVAWPNWSQTLGSSASIDSKRRSRKESVMESFFLFWQWKFLFNGHFCPLPHPHPPLIPLIPTGKDNVFLQQLINDRMTDFMFLLKEAESHCWATVSSGKLVHLRWLLWLMSFQSGGKPLSFCLLALASKYPQVIYWRSLKKYTVICIWLGYS